MNGEPSAAQQAMGDLAPKFAELTDNVLFGDIWERKELSKRDRSLITVAALVALNRTELSKTESRSKNSSRKSDTWRSTPVGPRP